VRPIHAALAAAALAAAVALPSVRNGFVEDDRWIVAQRPILRHPGSFHTLIAEPYWPRAFGASLWRPVALASFALDYRVSERPAWFHAVNVLWAAAAAGALTLLACSIAGTGAGLITGLLFASHPVHVEAFAGVVGRAELIAAFCYAVALLCALRVPGNRWWLLGVAAAAAFAIGAKEHAATLPAAVLLLLAARRVSWTSALSAAAVAAMPVALYFALRSSVIPGALAGGLAPGLEGLTLPARAWAMLGISLEWWRLLLFPAHLSADYSPAQVVVATGLTPRHLFAALLWLGALWAAWRARRVAPAVTIGLGWLVLTLLPVANLVPTEILVAERTLYLPSWGLLLAIGSAVMLARLPPRITVLAVALVAGLFAGRSIARIPAWRDDEHWYAALQHDAPRSYRTLWMQGTDEFAAGRWGSGERLLHAAIAAAPGIPGPREDLAHFYATAGLWAQAEAELRAAIPLNATRPRPWAMLPGVLLGRGDTAAAVATAGQALARFPADGDVTASALATLVAAHRCAAADSLFRSRGGQIPAGVRPAWQARVSACR